MIFFTNILLHQQTKLFTMQNEITDEITKSTNNWFNSRSFELWINSLSSKDLQIFHDFLDNYSKQLKMYNNNLQMQNVTLKKIEELNYLTELNQLNQLEEWK